MTERASDAQVNGNKNKSTFDVIVIGGGLSGLATARATMRAAKAKGLTGLRLAVLEASDRPGGTIQTDQDQGFTCEWGPNGFLDREPSTLELCSELGLDATLQPAAAAFKNRYIYREGRLHAVSTQPLRFLRSPLLPLGAKLRLACEPFIPRGHGRATDDDAIREESVAAFARRRIGRTAADILIDAMQSGIYAGDPEQLSVHSCFPRVVEVEQDFGSLIRGMMALARSRKEEMRLLDDGDDADNDATAVARETAPGAGPSGHLTSFTQGMQVLTDALAGEVADQLRCEVRVSAVRAASEGHGYAVVLDNDTSLRADAVVVACPSFVATGLLGSVDGELSSLLEQITYAPIAVLCLGYKRDDVRHPLDGFGFLAPHREELPLLGALFTSSIFPGRAPDGSVLIRALLGGARTPQIVDTDSEKLFDQTHDALSPVLGLRKQPHFVRTFVHRQAIPQYNLGHAERLAKIDDRLSRFPGLLLAGNAYRGIGVNDCVKQATVTADELVALAATAGSS